MRKISRHTSLFLLTVLSFLLMSWGYNGHYKINQGSSLSFTPEMEQFMSWAITLAEHASDADDRKDIDPEEGPRHYIDIDNYSEFVAGGRIPQTYDSVVALYGSAFVIDQGILPWATKRAYDSLVASFIRFDWAKAVLFASDLGHYVGDAHNPLHITRNYDGQFTNNDGIHSRYETGMINTFQAEIEITGDEISFVPDVQDYIFSYIYSNYIFVDSIMAADDYAKALAGNTSSYTYKLALWEKCRNFTIPLFDRASNNLAELIYTAWVEAGKPDMNSGPGILEFIKNDNSLQVKVSPNPLNGNFRVNFSLAKAADCEIKIINLEGTQTGLNQKENLPAGDHEYQFNLSELPEGIYLITVESGNQQEGVKIIKL